ncbi:type IVB secretion system protein IcmH/DotU [Pseudomonas guariconensis]|uniref:type IVB secretion system protein IcmH/DotU n=1 Tax=Pseudomonas TaxID=286 RepID=UPI0020971846|nr:MULTISPECIES: type IVB secretion system protein IcmH/DotU [Pseudomonas]MCO7517206.1 type IVB secretion system protein IcmH/DotU [Pseudomonas putida]MCO7595970.1 type IVB secretion system protein IcmH/DotU [Pseudomonas guariconensis]MCO7607497.1 type IVB secretion system protein IcmH/DotU [Pseudomonas guariconensis]MCO7635002.1 type IVB secretion system protein IcmH/DotU [Pseudomonas guariconensis]MCU7221857.1 type IVB secretion system protein IcmH/DotU [Pseudomonas brassicacearum]
MFDKTDLRNKKSNTASRAYDVTESRVQVLLEESAWINNPSSHDTSPPRSPSKPIGYPADPEFRLRGGYANPMVDAAMPLFGLAMRLRTLDALPHIVEVREKVHNQISAILEEMAQKGYEPAQLQAYSYALCLHLDEIVMCRPWGKNSIWSERPLLSDFHQETQGGEKIFKILSQMMQEPQRFKDVLEFTYLCLCLGLKGKYAIEPRGDELLQALLNEIYAVIRELRGPVPKELCDPLSNVAPRNFRMKRQLPWWVPLVISAVIMAGIYSYYSYRLNLITTEVLQSLDGILQQ